MSTLVPERISRLLARVRREVDEGRIPGCQVAIGFEGELAISSAHLRPPALHHRGKLA